MGERTHHRIFRPHKINMVCCHTRNNTYQRSFGYNSYHHYNVLRAMHRLISCEEGPVIWTWTKTRIAAILRIHPNTYQGNGPYARLSITGSPKAGGDNMDRGPSRSIPSPDKVTPLSNRLRGLPATSPLERVPPSTQDTHSRKVPVCAINPPSPPLPISTRFV
jgi:hypothetical protein